MLVIVAATIMIIALSIFAKMAMQTAQRQVVKQTAETSALTVLDTALANFVAINQRLPCPALGTYSSTSANPLAGVEQPFPATGICNPVNQNNGIVPWKTLGVPKSAAIDAYGNWITYRVYPGLVIIAPPYYGMNMTNCSAGGAVASTPVAGYPECTTPPAGCPVACTYTFQNNVLVGRGLPVTDGNGNWLNLPSSVTPAVNGGAAYVLIAHGQNGKGAYSIAGVLSPGTGMAGTSELLNQNGSAIMGGSVVATSYRDAAYNNTQTNQHFDDILSHPKILTVLTNANLKPRY